MNKYKTEMVEMNEDAEKVKDKNKEKKKDGWDKLEIATPFAKVVTWPILILILFWSLQVPLTATVEQLPNMLSKTSQITISGVTLEIDQRLQTSASPELKTALSNLSSDALKLLVRTGTAKHRTNSSSEDFLNDKVVLEELENSKLIILRMNVSDGRGYDVNWEATKLGLQAYEFILDVVIDQMLHAPPSANNN
jgi:hypothetical protein